MELREKRRWVEAVVIGELANLRRSLVCVQPKVSVITYKWMMKIQYISLVVIALASMVLSGCASDTATAPPPKTDLTKKRVHTQEELKKTGETETGPALEKVDPSVRTSGHP